MSATHMIGGVELPAAGTWSVDPGHAEVGFVGRHFGLTKIRGRFTGVDGTVAVAANPADSTIDVTIDMASVESGSADRDNHLRSADFFDVDNHPSARFRSTAIAVDRERASVTGELTIKGVTRPVVLDVEYLGYARDPWDNDRAVFSATATVNREEWGLSWNMLLDNGGLLVSKQIQLEIEVELIRRSALGKPEGN
jgi:polyisoprenoid-binding protein YceI